LDPGSKSPAAALTDMAWLVGHWKGTGLGGFSEEIWADPVGGVMMGMYRLVINGKPSFYEFMHLAEDQGTLVLRLKHFNPDMTAWEEKDRFVTFPLVKLGQNEVFFSGLTFRRVSERRLEIFLALRQNGKVREERFDLERQCDVSRPMRYFIVVSGTGKDPRCPDSRTVERYSFVTRVPSGVNANPLSCFCTRPLEINDIKAGL
jgi:hypothetical protein